MLYLFLLVFSLYRVHVLADYVIDDSNTSVLKYSENPDGPVWGQFGSNSGEHLSLQFPNGTSQSVDSTQCFDGTFTYAACAASNGCSVQFSFAGSGLTVYVLQAGPRGMSASLSIDSGTETTATLDAPPGPSYYVPHVVLFNVQGMTSGTHTVVMKVLDWNGSFSGMMLDYVDVNQDLVEATTSSTTPSSTQSSTPSSTTQPSTSASSPSYSSASTTSQQQIGQTTYGTSSGESSSTTTMFSSQSGVTTLPSSTTSAGNSTSGSVSTRTVNTAVVGAAVGGAVFLLALCGAALFLFERRDRLLVGKKRSSTMELLQPNARFMNPDGTSLQPSGTFGPSLRSTTDMENGSTPNYVDWEQSSSPMFGAGEAPGVFDSLASPILPVTLAVTTTMASQSTGYPSEKPLQLETASVTDTRQQDTISNGSRDVSETVASNNLTNEQVDFVHGLYHNNVPAPVVARVLERMIASPSDASPQVRGPDRWLRTGDYYEPETRPPSYDGAGRNA